MESIMKKTIENTAVETAVETVVSLSLSSLVFGDNIGKNRTTEENLIASGLFESVQAKGILSPIEVYPVGDKYEILNGNRRATVAKMQGITDIPCIIVNAPESVTARKIEQLHRNQSEKSKLSDLRPEIKRLIVEEGMTVEAVSKIVGFSEKSVSDALKISSLPAQYLQSRASDKNLLLVSAMPEKMRALFTIADIETMTADEISGRVSAERKRLSAIAKAGGEEAKTEKPVEYTKESMLSVAVEVIVHGDKYPELFKKLVVKQ
jgi:ParB/RepB/Spo0J family partition protein